MVGLVGQGSNHFSGDCAQAVTVIKIVSNLLGCVLLHIEQKKTIVSVATTVPVEKTFGLDRVYSLSNPILFAAVPSFLAGFSMDPSLPNDQEFLQLTVEGLSGVVKDVGGEGGFLHVQTEWNFQAHVLDYGDLTYKRLLSPFDVGLTLTLYHGDNRQHEVSILI